MPTSVRDWADVDYYALLGVAPDATDEEIARSYRALAKQLHPDRVGSRSTEQHQRFNEVTAAYEVLSNPRLRRDYDTVQLHDTTGVRPRPAPMGRVPRAPSTPLIHWTLAKARIAMAVGVLCLIGGIAMSAFMIGVHRHEATVNRGRVGVVALVANDPQGHLVVTYETADGQTITIPPPHRVNPGVLRPGDHMKLRYKQNDPTNVTVVETHFGRDFTLWFVAAKLLFGAPIIFLVGWRRARDFRT